MDEAQGLTFEDQLPLRWRPMAIEQSAITITKYMAGNEEVLRFISAMEDIPPENLDNEYPSFSQELTRVETKLDLLLDLMGQLIAVHFPLPSLKMVKMTPFGIEWIADEALHPDDYGLVEIYLNVSCPRPLVFPGKVERVGTVERGHFVNVKFVQLSEMIRERLEKIIFRHHRRKVALSRRQIPRETENLP